MTRLRPGGLLRSSSAQQLQLPALADPGHVTRQLMAEAALREIPIKLRERELAQRLDSRAQRLTRAAGFPSHKTPAELGSGAALRSTAISASAAVPGWAGLTMGLRTCARGQGWLFYTACSLVTQQREARDTRVLGQLWLWQKLYRCELLISDELGHVRFEREAAEQLCQVMAEHAGRGSITVTTGLAFSAWTQCRADTVLLEALPQCRTPRAPRPCLASVP